MDSVTTVIERSTTEDAAPADVRVTERGAHEWQDDGIDTHKGEYWYRCARCGRSDWIARYGTKDQLMPRECTPTPAQQEQR